MNTSLGELLVVRHGETEWSKSGQHTSFTDLPLLPEGEERARALASELAPYAPARILSSPLQRARHTAELAGFTDLEITDDLTEWSYGDYEGLTRQQVREQQPDWTIWTGHTPGGELITDVAARAERVIESVYDDLAAGKTVAVFSHGHFSRVLLTTWLGLAPQDGRLFTLDAGGYGVLGDDRGQRVVHHWNQR